MRKDGVFTQKEEAGEACRGGVVEGLQWVDGEGIAKMTQEGIDESHFEVIGGESQVHNPQDGCGQSQRQCGSRFRRAQSVGDVVWLGVS